MNIHILASSDSFLQCILVQATFFTYFFDKKFYFVMIEILPKLFSKMCFAFRAWAFDDIMKFEYPKS